MLTGLRRPVPDEVAGMLRLRTVGRRTGQERAVIVSYWEDGPNIVTLAMNGWGDVDEFAALRSRETPVVVLEPR